MKENVGIDEPTNEGEEVVVIHHNDTIHDNNEDEGIQEENALNDGTTQEEEESQPSSPYRIPENLREVPSHPLNNVIGDPHVSVRTRFELNQMIAHCAFVSQIEPKNFNEANNDSNWIIAMQEELSQFERNNVWELVPKPNDRMIIGTK